MLIIINNYYMVKSQNKRGIYAAPESGVISFNPGTQILQGSILLLWAATENSAGADLEYNTYGEDF